MRDEMQIKLIADVLRERLSMFMSEDETTEIIGKVLANLDEADFRSAVVRATNNTWEKASQVIDAFTWAYAPEGAEYWSNISNRVQNVEDEVRTKLIRQWREEAETCRHEVTDDNGKTIEEWIETLPQPHRAQLYHIYVNEKYKDLRSNSGEFIKTFYTAKHLYHVTQLADCLRLSTSVQGVGYWNNFFKRYEVMRDYLNRMAEIKREEEREQMRREEEERLEAKRVKFSDSFSIMLSEIYNLSDVAKYLRDKRNHDNSFANYITMRGEMATYLPNGREHKVTESGKWAREGRQEGRIGKLARKLLNEKALANLTDVDFEKFANAVKSYISVVGDEDGEGKKIEFKVVTGEDIRTNYYWRNYSQILGKETNLWGSCMRHEECKSYLDIYVYNPEVCSLLVAHDSEGKVLGRALLWLNTKGDKMMDTIYAHESLFNAFKGWAIDNDYFYKESQSCHHESFGMFDGKDNGHKQVSVQLKRYEFSEYPYLDTMKYLTECGQLTNDDSGDYKKLTNTDGTYEGGEEGVWSEYHDEFLDEDDAVRVDYTRPNGRNICSWVRYHDCVIDIDGDYLLSEDCVKVSGEWYLENDDRLVTDHDGDIQLESECVWSESMDEHIRIDDATKLHDGTYVLDEDAFTCQYDEETYHKDEAVDIDGVLVHKDNEEAYLETLTETN